MSNAFVDLPLPAGNGPGAAVDTSHLGIPKTIEVVGKFAGASITVEVSEDGGATFAPVVGFTDVGGKRVLDVVAQFMRVNVKGRKAAGFSADAGVGAPFGAPKFAAIAMPVGNNPGVPTDISAFGAALTVVVGGSFPGEVVELETSVDGSEPYAPLFSFAGKGGQKSALVTANFIRTKKGSASGAIAALGGATPFGSGVPNPNYPTIYNPYAPEVGNSFKTLQGALAFARLNQFGQSTVQFDNTRSGQGTSLAGPAGGGANRMTLTRNPANQTPFDPDMVGSNIFIDGAANPANIGQFPVTNVFDVDTLEYENAAGVAEPAFDGSWQVVGAGGITNVDIPPDDYDFTGIELFGITNNRSTVSGGLIPVRILDGVHRWSGLRKIGGDLNITNLVNAPNPSPIVVTEPIVFEFGLGDTGDYPTLTNTGTAALFDCSGISGSAQQLTLRMSGQFAGANPCMDFKGGDGNLNCNFGQFGRWRTGAIAGTNPASSINIANVGPQNEVGNLIVTWAGDIKYGAQAGSGAGAGGGNIPRSRMQMFPFSVGQAAPVPAAAPIANNTGLGHNGSYFIAPPGPGSLVQPLPQIRSAAPPNNQQATSVGALNSTGIAVEFVNVGAFPIDIVPDGAETINGGAGPFVIQPGCSASFRSDGVSNWRTVGYSPGAPSPAYAPANVVTNRAFDADTVVIADLADVVGTMIADLQAKGLLG